MKWKQYQGSLGHWMDPQQNKSIYSWEKGWNDAINIENNRRGISNHDREETWRVVHSLRSLIAVEWAPRVRLLTIAGYASDPRLDCVEERRSAVSGRLSIRKWITDRTG